MLGENDKKREKMLTITTIIEVVELLLRFVVVFMVLWQLVIINKDEYDACMSSDEELSAETSWMKVLLFSQSAFVVGFIIWRFRLQTFETIVDRLRMD